MPLFRKVTDTCCVAPVVIEAGRVLAARVARSVPVLGAGCVVGGGHRAKGDAVAPGIAGQGRQGDREVRMRVLDRIEIDVEVLEVEGLTERALDV